MPSIGQKTIQKSQSLWPFVLGSDFVYEEEYCKKPTQIIENTGDDTDFLIAFLENNTFVS